MMSKRSIAESIAIAFATTQWEPESLSRVAQSIFSTPQPWLADLASRVYGKHDTRPTRLQLQQHVSRDHEFRRWVKIRNLKTADLNHLLSHRSVASLDWHLPTLESTAQLASHLGISSKTLQWLAAVDGNPDQRPPHYVATWIKKRVSGYRLIESPKIRLKTAQRILLQDLLSHIPTHDAAHGFCKGRNVVSFVSPHVDQRFCLRMDLADFFPSVTGGRVFGMFRSAGFDRDVCRLLTGLCTTQTHSKIVDQMRPAGCRGAFELSRLYLPAHLPQGAPTSPAIANRIAYLLDCRLSGLARSANANYTRYADDLLFSGDNRFVKSAKRFATSVAAIAIEEGFQINFRKTRFQHSSQRQFAAGVVLNQHPNVVRTEFDRLKAILHNCIQQGSKSQKHGNVNFQKHLEGRVNWANQLNPTKGKKLLAMLQMIDWEQ